WCAYGSTKTLRRLPAGSRESSTSGVSADRAHPLRVALDAAGEKPDARARRDEKKNYAQRLSNSLAQAIADALRPEFPDVTPTAAGRGQESAVGIEKGQKRLDVKV